MNSIIVIRGDTIAFNLRPGGFGYCKNEVYLAPDIFDMIVRDGLFIPATDTATDIIPMLRSGRRAINAEISDQYSGPPDRRSRSEDDGMEGLYAISPGIKGVLISLDETGNISFYQVKFTRAKMIHLLLLPTGSNGFAVVTAHEHLAVQMMTCIRLTKSAQDTVAMFGRHVMCDPSSVIFYTRDELKVILTQFAVKDPDAEPAPAPKPKPKPKPVPKVEPDVKS